MFSYFWRSGGWICRSGAWICQLGVWICQLDVWICQLSVWNCQLGVWSCVLGVWNSILGVWIWNCLLVSGIVFWCVELSAGFVYTGPPKDNFSMFLHNFLFDFGQTGVAVIKSAASAASLEGFASRKAELSSRDQVGW